MGVIRIDECYPIATFEQLSGIGHKALRNAEDDGLQASWVGGKKYITGKAFYDYLESKRGCEPPNRGQRTAKRLPKQFSSTKQGV